MPHLGKAQSPSRLMLPDQRACLLCLLLLVCKCPRHRLAPPLLVLSRTCHGRMSKISGFSTERTKPFPVYELDFSRNEITKEGIGVVVQFARTQGSDATTINLSRNKLDDVATQDEVTRLVKNYSTFAANAFISELNLSGNNIGRAGEERRARAMALAQTAQRGLGWRRDASAVPLTVVII